MNNRVKIKQLFIVLVFKLGGDNYFDKQIENESEGIGE